MHDADWIVESTNLLGGLRTKRVKMLITLVWDKEKEPRLSFKIHGRTTIHLLRARMNAMDNIAAMQDVLLYLRGWCKPFQTASLVSGKVGFSSFSMKDLSAVVRTAHKQMIPAPICDGRGIQIFGTSMSSPKARV